MTYIFPNIYHIQWNLYNETGKVLLTIHKFHDLPGTVFTQSCLFSLPWKTTCLERPHNLEVALYSFHCTHWYTMNSFFFHCLLHLTSLWLSDAIWHHRSWSTLVQMMACHLITWTNFDYRKFSNIRRTKSQNLNVSLLILQLYLRNLLKPCVKARMKM